MPNLKLNFACQGYAWTKPLLDGEVKLDGVDLLSESLTPVQTFERLLKDKHFDAAEMGLTFYIGTLEHNDRPFIAIPVFPVRSFRLSCVYVRARSDIRAPKDLIGKRCGEAFIHGHDAGIWARGILRDYYGVPFDSYAAYFIGGVGRPAAKWDWLPFDSEPAARRVKHIGSDRTLDGMLEAGEIDVLFSAIDPPGLATGAVRRLFQDAESAERDYFAKSRIYPIMHTVVIRTPYHARNPHIATALYRTLKELKGRVIERERAQEYIPMTRMLPLYTEHQREMLRLMGPDYWPYGVEANRKALDDFLGYHHDLGISKRRWRPEELFVPETLNG
jgi:4,5-dihydroxyphthalate decarboxylase